MDWQQIVVAGAVLGAAAYLVRRGYQKFTQPACSQEGCSTCPGNASGTPKKHGDLVQIRLPKKHAHRGGRRS